MLKCASVYTYEMDDHDVAMSEIKTQLDEKLTLLENSVGVIMCHPEFIGSGALKHICDNLPFDLAGVTTSSQGVNGGAGEMILTIFVMTSDDVLFKVGATADLTDDITAPTTEAINKAMEGMEGQPKLALVFPPLIAKYAGDAYVDIFGKIIPKTPVFGTLAIDDSITFSDSEVIYNGETDKTAMSFVLCYGSINPRFLIGLLPESNTMPYKGEITKSDGPYVAEINNMNAYKYFEELGFMHDGDSADGFLFVPFLIDQKNREDYDGIPVLRVLASFTPDGSALYRGNIDENSIFSMLKGTPEGVISTTMETLGKIGEMDDVNGVLLFSCIIRRMMVMEIDPLLEIGDVKNKIDEAIPFMIGYAGGEVCPTSVKDGVPINRFHNYSLIALVV